MRVATLAPTKIVDLEAGVGTVLDRRLLTASPHPIALALSGGGDSVALLLAAAAWADRAERRLLVLTVDHQLRPESAAWTRACAASAKGIGADFHALAWTGDKPTTGLPAAARAGRHALLGEAARGAGARVILLGHTADDVLEAGLMRQTGSTTPAPREWSPSPVWPQGRGVFLLRPLLDVRRLAIRDWLAAKGESWIDDPANEDETYSRARARQALAAGAQTAPEAAVPAARTLALACREDGKGGLQIRRVLLRDAEPGARARFVSAACLCAAGTDRPPSREKVVRLAERLISGEAFVTSLAGARIEASGALALFGREPGEVERGGLQPLALKAGETGVWDGRFEIAADRGVEVKALRRATLPVATDGQALSATPLAYERLLAACGVIEREPA